MGAVMRLVCNLSMLGDKPTGLGVYADKCLSYLSARYNLDYVAGQGASYPGTLLLKAPESVAIGGGVKSAVRRQRWASSIAFPSDSLVYSPTHHGFSSAKRQILTIHDLICFRFPSQHLPQYAFFKWMLPKLLRKTEAIFVVSETTKMDVADAYRYPHDRIFVVPNSVNRAEFVERRSVPSDVGLDPYLLMVGARYHHKNVDEVLDVHSLWSARYKLVVASCSGKYRRHLETRVRELGIDSRVVFKDYISFGDLVGLYQNASALLYPSKWEGFGIPPLEALASGCRVILSDIQVHREIFAGAASFVRLGDRDDWGNAISSLSSPISIDMAAEVEKILERYTPSNTGEKLVTALLAVEPRMSELAKSPVYQGSGVVML